MSKLWTAEVAEATEHIYQQIIKLPFITQLADGTLDPDIFQRYIQQDTLYIHRYSRVLAHIASRVTEPALTEIFLKFAGDGVAVEKALHSHYLKGALPAMSPACVFYTSLLEAQANRPVEVEIASVLPCFLIYHKVGLHIIDIQTNSDSNPYQEWIATYSDPAFAESCNLISDICNEMARDTTPEVRKAMTGIYIEAARQEWLFWKSAYENLNWPAELL